MKTLSMIALSLAAVATNAATCGPQKATGLWDVQLNKTLLCTVSAEKPAVNGIAQIVDMSCNNTDTSRFAWNPVLSEGTVNIAKDCSVAIDVTFSESQERLNRKWNTVFSGYLDKGKTVSLGTSTIKPAEIQYAVPNDSVLPSVSIIATAVKR